jgi:hypothetical protein
MFRSAVYNTRTKLYNLKYKVRFVGAGDVLSIASPDGQKRVEVKSAEELNNFVAREKINLDVVAINENMASNSHGGD